ncbi:scavenger receptor class F member 1 [Synchiropus picturatus]
MKLLLKAVSFSLLCVLASLETLDPAGRNVCHNPRNPSTLVCCTGWQQKGQECTTAVCEGEQACQQEELCVYPGVCRCPPGFYGAQCKTRCPPEFWASDCRQQCPCYPHGSCDPATGECTCNSNRWGPRCQFSCRCARHGHCHPLNGNCTCDTGWWAPTCAKPCGCAAGGSVGPGCDQMTGRCQCHRGHWGQKCLVSCNCHLSECNQRTGACECAAGWWGPSCNWRCNCDLRHGDCDPATGVCVCHPGFNGTYCNKPCIAGKYGSGCKMSCGHCQSNQTCSRSEGVCAACAPGWRGPRCDQRCVAGYYGDRCRETCLRCWNNKTCHHETGECRRCEPGWTGPRCEAACVNRTYGDACSFLCGPCFHGNCHHVTGKCICEPGFQGESCNSSCSALQFGLNCSSVCDCAEGVGCHHVTGSCHSGARGALLAGLLVPLLLLLVCVCCCCLCCGGRPAEGKDSTSATDAGVFVRMKYHVYSVLANVSAALPCVSSWSTGLPRVTVSHHDPELTFNHSFIEPPSSGWVTEGSSFDSDEEEGEALYCVPPREDFAPTADFQEVSSKCNMLLDPSSFSAEDMASPFNIPRTSSIAKAKRPSVSFAEGTRFSPKERRGSAQDLNALTAHNRKPKTPWGVLMMSSLQSQGEQSVSGEAPEGLERGEEVVQGADKQDVELTDQEADEDSQTPQTTAPDFPAEVPNKVTTVYVTVGRAGRPASKVDSSSEGPVQAMLRRLGSLQRRRDQDQGQKTKGTGGIVKPPRRKLGSRASMWEQGGPLRRDGSVCKPVRRKQGPVSTDGGTTKRPLSSILKRVSEVSAADPGQSGGVDPSESGYLTVGAPAVALSDGSTGALVGERDEPCYENILVPQS